MEIALVKENIPHSVDGITPKVVVPVNKMATNQTPRLPLADLKQVARPCSNQKRKSRSSFPLLTPNGKKPLRKIQPSTLVYQEDKENETEQVVAGDSSSQCRDIQDNLDARLESFVTSVLDKCVKDVTDNGVDVIKNEEHSKPGSEQLPCTDRTTNPQIPEPSNPSQSHNDVLEHVIKDETRRNEHTNNTGTLDSSMLTEEILLRETSSYSLRGDSFSESTKSEDELLASFVQSPDVDAGSVGEQDTAATTTLSIRQEEELKTAMFKVRTPHVNFLDQVALTERVRKATNSIESFVTHKEHILPELKLTWTQGDCTTVKQNHSDRYSHIHKPELLNKSINTEMFTPERKASHSVSCSPLQFIQHDVGIQNGVDMESVFCSPIPNSCSDASTQKETETQSTLCSPIRIPGLDMSIQAVVETRSVMCTPIRVPVQDTSTQNVTETQSTSCSPMLVPVTDSSTQNEIENKSVMCSPMVPCPSEDKSILVAGPDLVDLCIGTDEVCTKDEGVNVQPDTTTTSTTMEDCPMVSSGTAMTPLKVNHKQGKRLTADDVRKQHPRVLANELDTLRTQNNRLESRVHSLQQDIKKLASYEEVVTDLENARSMLEGERDLYWREYGEWKRKCEEFERENETLRSTHSEEISALKESYESQDYHSHFLVSQKLVGDLQAELTEYKELLPDLEQSQQILADLKVQYTSSFMKVKRANENLKEQKAELNVKEVEVIKLKSECELIAESNKGIETERQQMTETISALKTSLTKLEEEIHTKNEDLKQLAESRARVKFQATAIVNLERTLENRDKDIDMYEKDLFECREVICKQIEERTVAEERDKSQTAELKELREENIGLKDCLARLRAKEQEARDGWTIVQEELGCTKEHASRIIKKQGAEIADCSQSIGQLTDHMTSVLADLKTRAGFNDEDTSAESIKTTTTESQSVPKKKKWAPKRSFVSQILMAVETADPEHCANQGTSTKNGVDKRTADKTTSRNKKHEESDKSISKFDPISGPEKVNSSGSINDNQCNDDDLCKISASEHEKAGEPLAEVGKNDKNVTTRGNQVLKKKKSIVNFSSEAKNLLLMADYKNKNMESGVDVNEENKLSDQLGQLREMFTQVIHVASLIEKALRSSLQDMRSDDFDLRSKVYQCEYSEKRARAQLEVVQAELETSQKLVKQKQALIEEQSVWLEGMLDAQSEAEKEAREREIRLLRSKIQSLEGEREIMNEQFNELLHKVQTNSAEKAATVDVDAHKEIILLKKKIDKYRLSIVDNQEMIAQERINANERLLKMEENWKKADAEVVRLCKRIDSVRSALVVSKKFTEDPDLQRVIQVIDESEVDSGSFLKPMKTSRW